MDITKFAEQAKQRGYIEWSEALSLKELAEVWIEYQELREEMSTSQYPLTDTASEARLAELRVKMRELEAQLNL